MALIKTVHVVTQAWLEKYTISLKIKKMFDLSQDRVDRCMGKSNWSDSRNKEKVGKQNPNQELNS